MTIGPYLDRSSSIYSRNRTTVFKNKNERSSLRFKVRFLSHLRRSLHERRGADVHEGAYENLGKGPRDYRRQEGGHGRHRHRQGDVSVGDEGHQIRRGAPCDGAGRSRKINQTGGEGGGRLGPYDIRYTPKARLPKRSEYIPSPPTTNCNTLLPPGQQPTRVTPAARAGGRLKSLPDMYPRKGLIGCFDGGRRDRTRETSFPLDQSVDPMPTGHCIADDGAR